MEAALLRQLLLIKSSNMMVQTASVLIFCVNLLLIIADQDCDLGTLYYQQIGCKPIHKEGSTCPTAYECPTYARPPNKCLFQGKTYENQQRINDTTGCNNFMCYCSAGEKGIPGTINCAIVDCYWGPLDPGCYLYRTEIGTCCTSGTRCEPYGDIATCEVDGKSLREGEAFTPEGTCYNCLCQKGYDGIPKEPFCKKRQCDTEIRNAEYIENKCAPIYRGEQCCPSEFLCAKDAGQITVVGGDSDKDQFCTFGKTKVPVNGQFDAVASSYGVPYNVSCSCKVPPLPLCTLIS